MLAGDVMDLRERVDRRRADGSGRADHDEWAEPRVAVRDQFPAQRVDVHALVGVGRDPANRCRAETAEVGGLLDPRMGLRCAVGGHPALGVADAVRPNFVAGLGAPRREEPEHVCHVAAADHQAAASVTVTSNVADQFGNPAYRLGLDLGRHRREVPQPDIGIDRGGQHVGQRAEGSGGGGDVAEEAWMPVVQRIVEQQRRRRVEQRRCGLACLREPAGSDQLPRRVEIEGTADRPVRQRLIEVRDLVDEPVSGVAE